jgi:hypothetical protein
MTSDLTPRRRTLQGLAALAALPAATSWAAIGGLPSAEHRDSSPEWERLSGKLFGGKPLIHGQRCRAAVRAACARPTVPRCR